MVSTGPNSTRASTVTTPLNHTRSRRRPHQAHPRAITAPARWAVNHLLDSPTPTPPRPWTARDAAPRGLEHVPAAAPTRTLVTTKTPQ
ncbi:hypothetical protein Acsp05_27570 [Actinokineospora sp. NBRC 105648]|nr:hypothetical protein Acsp05_27570 [Actinokineospora sp. NBRC 105648]